MKKIYSVFVAVLIVLFFSATAFAQDTLSVLPVTKSLSKGNQSGFKIIIPENTKKDVISDWKKMLRKNKAIDNSKNPEYKFIISLPEVSRDTVFIYTMFNEVDRAVELIGFISADDSVFISSGEIAENFKTYIRNFSVNEYREAVRDRLEIEKNVLKKLESDQTSLEKDIDGWHKDSKENTRVADRYRDEISVTQKEQEMKNDAIYSQKKVLATFQVESDQKTVEEKKLKDLEKEKRKIQSKIEALYKKIDNLEGDNKQLERKIDKSTSETIPDKRNEIAKQKDKTKATEVVLNGIR